MVEWIDAEKKYDSEIHIEHVLAALKHANVLDQIILRGNACEVELRVKLKRSNLDTNTLIQLIVAIATERPDEISQESDGTLRLWWD